ncbi:Rgp1-domain-containing protein [Hymenopellis radicata]|nr:Rgp1-domain-containing protein [Hymenopellis radicata]
MSATSEPDAAVRVTVAPSQSSYFAGETFTVTVTFTNTHSPEAAQSSQRSNSHTHRRGAHSISSAPLSKPPTSPGTPRTPAIPVPTRQRSIDPLPIRRGLVGQGLGPKGADVLPELIEQRRKRLLAKSLSVSTSPQELPDQVPEIPKSASYAQQSHPTFPKVSSPLSRSETLPLAANHPHARKDSLLDGQLDLQEMASPTSATSSLMSPSSSTSTFSLALESIAESSGTRNGSTPALPSHLEVLPSSHLPPNAVHAYPSSYRPRRPVQIGLGQPPPQSNLLSDTELILYSYAQLAGTLTISSSPTLPDHTQKLGHLRSSLRRTSFGGGSMDITSSLHQRPPARRSHSRSSSISSGLLSLLSPTLSQTQSSPPSSSSSSTPRTPSSSLSFSPSSSFANRMGFGANDDIDPDAPLPTFQNQPVMLAVDMSLQAGESKSYTYSMPLPANLPPTFRGRSFRFSYELVVGTCRAGSSTSSSLSRVMKIPIRIYNNVVVGRIPRPYDLTWPIRNRTEVKGSVVEDVGVQRKVKSGTGSLEQLKGYAERLVGAIPDPSTNGMVDEADREWRRRYSSSHTDEDVGGGGLSGCREAVEILTRNPKKVSYDVNKDGVKVAVLTFTKSAYRLGETVLGVVEINDRTSRSRVLQMSAMLETQELLPSSISSQSNSRQLRRIHAEHHSSFTLSMLRTTFTLDIPSDGSPAFQVSIGDDPSCKPGGLEWKVRLCLLVSVSAETSLTGTEGVRMKSMVRDGMAGEWGASWWATQSIAPLEKPAPTAPQNQGWASYIASSLLGSAERPYHDGDEAEPDTVDGIKADPGGGVGVGVDFGGGDEGWKAVKVETVECEVPIKVWPGNTAFKASDVVFTV